MLEKDEEFSKNFYLITECVYDAMSECFDDFWEAPNTYEQYLKWKKNLRKAFKEFNQITKEFEVRYNLTS